MKTIEVPYAPDLRKMDEAFPKLNPGDVITWPALAAAVDLTDKASRFWALQSSWRKRVFRERNVLLVSVRGKGLQVASPSDRVTTAADQQKRGVRKIFRGAVIAGTTDLTGLPDHLRRTAEHTLTMAGSLKLLQATKPKELGPI